MATSVTLRPPVSSTAKAPEGLSAPSVEWLTGTWHVTHATLPMWKKNRNVRITYTPLKPEGGVARLDDNVSFQPLGDTKIRNVNGIDTAEDGGWGYGWRGKGLLKVASSKWEVMGYGKEEGTDNEYCVTYFNKTIFTPPGIDLYSRKQQPLKPETVEAIKKALAEMADETVNKIAAEIFEVVLDDGRKDDDAKKAKK